MTGSSPGGAGTDLPHDGARRGGAPGAARLAAPGAARLEVDIEVPARGVRLALAPRPGRITAVIGPNGAGKSTLLGAISGAVAAEGSVRADGREILPLPAHRRGVSHLRQDPVLFEHLDVLENVAFGPRAAGTGRRAARQRARMLLDELGIAQLAARRPRQISGGQAQRVAIARALAAEPALVLLDEPFAALDAEASARLRGLCAQTLAGRTVLLVTHDLLDVLALAEDLVVLDGGRLAQAGELSAVLSRPRTAFAAHLMGKELAAGTVESVEDGLAVLRTTSHGTLLRGTADPGLRPGQAALALIDPAHVRLEVPGPDPSAGEPEDPHAHTVRVEAVDRVGTGILVRGGGLAAQIPVERALVERIGPGATVRMILDPVRSALYAEGDEHEPAPRAPRPHPRRAPGGGPGRRP